MSTTTCKPAPNIYAAGDVLANDLPKVTPAAYFESKYLMRLFSGQTSAPIDYPVIPSVVFTSPRIAQAGMKIPAAEKAGLTVSDNGFSRLPVLSSSKEPIAASKQVHDQDGHLVGVTEISDQLEDAVNALLPAIEYQLDREQIDRLIQVFSQPSATQLGTGPKATNTTAWLTIRLEPPMSRTHWRL